MSSTAAEWDVAIIGGGPGGSTTGSLLKKYKPEMRVLILERETFPRDHIGESQLPVISDVLDEMGCWDKVEAANFPIKVGGTFRWGKNPELWDFEFLPLKDFKDEPRPAKFEGQRRQTAFQVDRSIYDEILLDHAAELGCTVREGTGVRSVETDGDRVTGLTLDTGETVTARHYVDASGNAAILRRTMNVPMDVPTQLMNIAIYDYWTNTEWAVEIGVGGTRIQVMSVGFGWLWFIPIGPTRTSLGLVCPVSYYKASGKTPEQLYVEAIAQDARISKLIANGTRTGRIRTTNDWSYVSQRTFGENWFLVGETAGFADPILSAGLSLTHTGARELAYTILALDRQEHDGKWLKDHYCRLQRSRVRQHMRFAEYWYAANGQFTNLQDHCQQIARDAGLDLSAKQSWAWLARGGFATDVAGQAGIGGYSLAAVKGLAAQISDEPADWRLNEINVLQRDLTGAVQEKVPHYQDGRIREVTCFVRGANRLTAVGMYDVLLQLLAQPTDAATLLRALNARVQSQATMGHANIALRHALQSLEVMVVEGWVKGRFDPKLPKLQIGTPKDGAYIHAHSES